MNELKTFRGNFRSNLVNNSNFNKTDLSSGFLRDLKAEKIVDATDTTEQLTFLIKYSVKL